MLCLVLKQISRCGSLEMCGIIIRLTDWPVQGGPAEKDCDSKAGNVYFRWLVTVQKKEDCKCLKKFI